MDTDIIHLTDDEKHALSAALRRRYFLSHEYRAMSQSKTSASFFSSSMSAWSPHNSISHIFLQVHSRQLLPALNTLEPVHPQALDQRLSPEPQPLRFWRGGQPQQLSRFDLQHGREPGDDLQPRIARAFL
jgi:hypothetical protein